LLATVGGDASVQQVILYRYRTLPPHATWNVPWFPIFFSFFYNFNVMEESNDGIILQNHTSLLQ
jgi:hypothetical protein